MALVVTENAARQILQSARDSGQLGSNLRVAAKRTADGSVEYAMGFDEKQSEDVQVNWHGVNIIVAPTSTELLSGTTLDYVELESGKFEFIFMNPNDPNYVPPEQE
ncbi:HesB/IscA family protein [Pseudomonadota bacterium]